MTRRQANKGRSFCAFLSAPATTVLPGRNYGPMSGAAWLHEIRKPKVRDVTFL